MSTRSEYIKSVTESIPDELQSPFTAASASKAPSGSSGSFLDYFANISWQTWIIIILILALLGINIFAYLAKGTQATATIFDQVFTPILKLFGFNALETTKQTVQTSATGTKAGVDIVSGATTGAITTIEKQAAQNQSMTPISTSGTSIGVSTTNIPQGQMAASSQQGVPVQKQIQDAGSAMEWQEDTLQKALGNASQEANIMPDDSRSSIQTTGKSGWCYIGEEQGIRTCAPVGVNDMCMSGDVFPSQEICMNPNLRA